MREFYRRKLPHWQVPGAIYFITYRTVGSLPKPVELKLRQRSEKLKSQFACESPDSPILAAAWKKLFGYLDTQLGASPEGCILREPAAASLVVTSIRAGVDLLHYRLHRFCVMPNHVHLLIEPLTKVQHDQLTVPLTWPPLWFTEVGQTLLSASLSPDQLEWWSLAEIMKPLKGASARAINKAMGKTGPVWQDESFDHWVRDGEEYERIIKYIDDNPVKAGLCKEANDWRWSSAGQPKTP